MSIRVLFFSNKINYQRITTRSLSKIRRGERPPSRCANQHLALYAFNTLRFQVYSWLIFSHGWKVTFSGGWVNFLLYNYCINDRIKCVNWIVSPNFFGDLFCIEIIELQKNKRVNTAIIDCIYCFFNKVFCTILKYFTVKNSVISSVCGWINKGKKLFREYLFKVLF